MLPAAFVVARRAPKAARTGRWQICRASRHSLDHANASNCSCTPILAVNGSPNNPAVEAEIDGCFRWDVDGRLARSRQ
jgi:hypothetical protein